MIQGAICFTLFNQGTSPLSCQQCSRVPGTSLSEVKLGRAGTGIERGRESCLPNTVLTATKVKTHLPGSECQEASCSHTWTPSTIEGQVSRARNFPGYSCCMHTDTHICIYTCIQMCVHIHPMHPHPYTITQYATHKAHADMHHGMHAL